MENDYCEQTAKWLNGRKVKHATVDGYKVDIEFEDGTRFHYSASDGGYSCWDMYDDMYDDTDELDAENSLYTAWEQLDV